MAHQALYRKYRPQNFDEVVEQKHIVTTLKNAVISGNISHAYLFSGTRGTGKTTMAKIFARAVNCLEPHNGNPCNKCEICQGIIDGTILDVTEIDAASNNSVDNVRAIIDEVVYTPTRSRKKVYIVDEVHMLSSGAFNALLKTLEEPPEHVMFILATTEPHKLPATVLSRCQRFDFRRIPIKSIAERLLQVARDENVDLTTEAVYFIATLSEGALRDGISILDQCIATGNNPLDLKTVHDIVGIAPNKLVLDTAEYLIERNGKEAINAIDCLISDGKDPGQFLQRLIQLFRDILVYIASNSMDAMLSLTEEEKGRIPLLAQKVSMVDALAVVRELSELESSIRWSSSSRILLETALLRICYREMNRETDSLMDRIRLIEERIRALETDRFSYNGNSSRPADESDSFNKVVDTSSNQNNMAKNTIKANENFKESIEPYTAIENTRPEKTEYKSKPFIHWDNVLDDIFKNKRVSLYSNLMGTTAIWKDEHTIGIILPEEESFKKTVIARSENIKAIEESIIRSTGQNLLVEVIINDEKEKKNLYEGIPDKIIQFAEKNGLKLDIIDE
ncbi:MAG: DNA polymerase III subunit gamma/tau [Thermoanaerobacterales bacterium]|nr:DNA polymerase III subunit gamma/tau [Thermoanaerobacterales bacterium]